MKEQTKMKTVEQLKKLSNNPYYVMSDEEAKVLENASTSQGQVVSSVEEDNKKKESDSTVNVTVKEIGKLDKQHGDPRSE